MSGTLVPASECLQYFLTNCTLLCPIVWLPYFLMYTHSDLLCIVCADLLHYESSNPPLPGSMTSSSLSDRCSIPASCGYITPSSTILSSVSVFLSMEYPPKHCRPLDVIFCRFPYIPIQSPFTDLCHISTLLSMGVMVVSLSSSWCISTRMMITTVIGTYPTRHSLYIV